MVAAVLLGAPITSEGHCAAHDDWPPARTSTAEQSRPTAPSGTNPVGPYDPRCPAACDSWWVLLQVMRDISVLVVEQGSMIDRVDQNITTAAEHVERGVEHIRRAHEASKGGAMATCIFVLLVAIAIMFVIMLFVKVIW